LECQTDAGVAWAIPAGDKAPSKAPWNAPGMLPDLAGKGPSNQFQLAICPRNYFLFPSGKIELE